MPLTLALHFFLTRPPAELQASGSAHPVGYDFLVRHQPKLAEWLVGSSENTEQPLPPGVESLVRPWAIEVLEADDTPALCLAFLPLRADLKKNDRLILRRHGQDEPTPVILTGAGFRLDSQGRRAFLPGAQALGDVWFGDRRQHRGHFLLAMEDPLLPLGRPI